MAFYAQAFGMQVQIGSTEHECMQARQDGWLIALSRENLFCEADILSVHLPHTKATQEIISRSDLAQMKSDAQFVNTSHAGLLQPGALEAALQQGQPGSAVLDVFEQEPLPKEALLQQMANVLATPNVGGLTRQHAEALYQATFQHIADFASSLPHGA